jgi:hypothetical protein
MVDALVGVKRQDQPDFGFYEQCIFGSIDMPKEYFSSVVSVSFSAFDPFLPPVDRLDRSRGPVYFYIGMKNARFGQKDPHKTPPKSDAELVNDFVTSFRSCLSQPAKKKLWLKAVERLESDVNFTEMNLPQLLAMDDKDAVNEAARLAGRMSSGHSIVLLTITKLVDTVEEKTLVLMDEPESHLHPPLLSAFTRALSDLLYSRNAVAIVANHSPVVLIPIPIRNANKITCNPGWMVAIN